jgi:ferric-dicitrate binding protein FerR (iron transport regulator)
VNSEDWIAYLDGELSPEAQAEVERELARDPARLGGFRALCRQRVMLAETLKAAPRMMAPRKSPFRLRWQIAAATLLFAATVAALWLKSPPSATSRVVHGSIQVAGAPVRSLPADTLAETPSNSAVELALPDGSSVALLPATRAILRGVPGSSRQFVELRKGTARVQSLKGDGEVRTSPALTKFTVRGAGFSVELVPEPFQGGTSMESLLALVVSALVGNVQVDLAGKIQVVPAGEIRVIGADGMVAKSLPEFVAFQDEKKDSEKDEKEGKEKKGKKKGDKKDKKDKKDKEDDDDKNEKKGKDNEEKGGKKDKN